MAAASRVRPEPGRIGLSRFDTNFQRAREILDSSVDKLHTMAQALIRYETIDEQQIKDIMAGKDPKPPQDWDDSSFPTGGKTREREPTETPIGRPASQH